jgi:hypothetical protein
MQTNRTARAQMLLLRIMFCSIALATASVPEL